MKLPGTMTNYISKSLHPASRRIGDFINLTYYYDSLLYLIISKTTIEAKTYNKSVNERIGERSVLYSSQKLLPSDIDFEHSFILQNRLIPFTFRPCQEPDEGYLFDIVSRRLHGSEYVNDITICRNIGNRLGMWFAGYYILPNEKKRHLAPWRITEPERIIRIRGMQGMRDIPEGATFIPEIIITEDRYINWALIFYDLLIAFLAEYQKYFPSPIEIPRIESGRINIPGGENIHFHLNGKKRKIADAVTPLREHTRRIRNVFEYYIYQERMRDAIAKESNDSEAVFSRLLYYNEDYHIDETCLEVPSKYDNLGDESAHPSGFSNPSRPYLTGDAAVQIGMAKKKSDEVTRKLKTRIINNYPQLAVKIAPGSKMYWFNRDFPGDEFKRLEAIYPDHH